MNTIFYPLLGGAFIGLSAALLWLFLGRISGISGILWGALKTGKDKLWRYLFLLGLVIGTGLFHLLSQQAHPSVNASPLVLVIAGVLVGIGVKIGSGCTSGHGVCGIARGSLRSVSATLIFMAAAMLTVFLMKGVSL